MNVKKDIEGLDEIKVMVDDFYNRIKEDDLLTPIFNFRLSTHWAPYLEKMYAFWNAVIFGVKGYNGNPFMKHATMELDPEHLKRWINTFNQTIDSHFEGPIAEEAKISAAVMASMFMFKLDKIKHSPITPLI
jgi:hemoglobin